MSAEAQRFIRAALAKSSLSRPSAQELLQHAWIKPHLMRKTSLSQEQAEALERCAHASLPCSPVLSPAGCYRRYGRCCSSW
jgi:hypothetical protein